MKWVVVLLIILLASSVCADWNAAYNNTCGNNAVEMGEDCDPPGKDCYTKSFLEGKCTKDCACKEYFGPSCGNSFVEDNEDCESDANCPMFYYCNANCRCIAKVAPEQNKTVETEEKSPENLITSSEPTIDTSDKKNNTVYKEFIINESYFEAEKFNESIGIKITGAITKVTKSLFGSLFDLIKRWFL